jgi:N-acyl-D-aspartate/D-glutamate deacylase
MSLKFKKRYVLPAIATGFLFVGVSFKENFFEVAKQIEIFTMVFKELDKNYVDEINPGDLMDKAIKSMLADLDPYTNFFNEADVVKFKINNTGEYTGIGAMITRVETKLIVKEAYKDMPADKAGLKAGDEIIQIGKITKMPVQISHIKLAKKSDWGTAETILAQLEKARAEGVQITADVYPYTFWNSTLRVLFPARDYSNMASAQLAVTQLFDPTASYIVQFAPQPSYVGKTLSTIAKERNETDAQALINLVAMAADFKQKNPGYKGSIEAIAAKSMSDEDVAKFIEWPYAVICSDGNAGGHPRGYGSFPRILGKYVRTDKVIDLTNAIYKMTGQTAAYLGIKERGVIAVGKIADLVLFNPATVNDNATIMNSKAISDGIAMVWVNGSLVYKDQKATGNKPGTLIRR